MEVKKKVWGIRSLATIYEKVSFEEPMTRKEAREAYFDGEHEDVLDIDILAIEEIQEFYEEV